jgi:hypothetical protein
LSPRIVHFTKTRILWECRAYVVFEDFPSQVCRGFIDGEILGIPGFPGASRVSKQIDTWRLFDGHHERYENKIDWSLKIPQSAVQIPADRFLDREYKEDIRTCWLTAVEL